MRNAIFLAVFAIAACSSPKNQEEIETSKFQTTGSVERLDSAINSLIASDAKIEVLASGFEWAEGPLWLEEQQALIFTDGKYNDLLGVNLWGSLICFVIFFIPLLNQKWRVKSKI